MRLPDDSKRHVIVGTTGSGKSVAAAWHLSKRSWDKKPWVIYDPKRDELLNAIPGAEEIAVTDKIPKHPGIYLVHNRPDELPVVANQLWEIWQRESIGVYADEGYMISGGVANGNPAFRALLTQGRSKNIPMIVNSQRPAWIDRFVFSESEFIQVFRLNHSDDRKTAEKFLPVEIGTLPEYHSYYYDVGKNECVILRPVPGPDEILSEFQRRYDLTRQKVRRFV